MPDDRPTDDGDSIELDSFPPEEWRAEKWDNDFRPTYHPDWGDGQIHLDGEKDFPGDADAREVVDDLQERCEVIGGLCTHNPDERYFTTTAQFGYLVYRVHYDEDGAITEIDLKEDGEEIGTYAVAEIIAHHEAVVEPLKELLEKGEWVIETDNDPQRITDL